MHDCCSDKEAELEVLKHRQASILKIVLVLNAAMFVVEFWAGLVSGSSALLADSLDMLGDALVYAFSLYAVFEGSRTKALSALFKGVIMAAFGLVAVGQVVYKLAVPSVPSYATIGVIGLLALAVNAACLLLLMRHRSDDINMSSVWLCSRNDVLANAAVLAAAGGVWLTARSWPDLLVGVGIAVLFLKSATTVLSGALRELRRAES